MLFIHHHLYWTHNIFPFASFCIFPRKGHIKGTNAKYNGKDKAKGPWSHLSDHSLPPHPVLGLGGPPRGLTTGHLPEDTHR